MESVRDAGTELFRIPPFADAHMHFTLGGKLPALEQIRSILEAYARCGIFSVWDMGHRSGLGLMAKALSSAPVKVRSAGYALFKKGGYGSFLGKCVSKKEEIRRAMKEIFDAGADFIKVLNSGIVSPMGGGIVSEGGFSPEELSIICEEARQRCLHVACHANSDRAIRAAVRAGAGSIEHGFFVSGETLHMMAESRVSWTPTVHALLHLTPALGPSGKKYIEEVTESHLASLSYAASIGVSLHIGTDSGSAGVRHGESFLEELRLFRRAGLDFAQILSAACMEEAEIGNGNYLLVKKDFISTGRIEYISRAGTAPDPQGA
ncbi:MAG: amidohydrolase family protein [Nitrospirae bacterium]|nr:amidohydrolase family protein [Nitrospirota bacterium]